MRSAAVVKLASLLPREDFSVSEQAASAEGINGPKNVPSLENRTIEPLHTISELIDRLNGHGDRQALLVFRKQEAEQWTYDQFADQVLHFARALRARGIAQRETVPLFANAGPRWIIAALAVMKLGAIPLPLDVQLDNESLRHILIDSDAHHILTSSNRLEQLKSLSLKNLQLIQLDEQNTPQDQTGPAGVDNWPRPEPKDTAVLFYTSGTTGKPKGVPLSHANLAYQINTIIQEGIVTPLDRALLPLPLHHVYPFVIGMLSPLALGLPIILPQALTGPQIFRALREGRATVLIGVPRLYQALVAGLDSRVATLGFTAKALYKFGFATSRFLRKRLHVRAGRFLLYPLHVRLGNSLRMVASGGALLEPELGLQLETIGWQVAAGYGLTETSPLLTINPPGKAHLDTVGRPIAGTDLRIEPIDNDQGEQKRSVGDHPSGEIVVRGPGVFSGYLHLPELTRRSFTADGWFRTGDLGYLDLDHYLHVVGRASTMIKTQGGEKVQPEDLEKAYLENEAIREIGILEDQGKLVALIVPKAPAQEKRHPQRGQERERVKQALEATSRQLASHQRISDFAITNDPLPRTRLGKIRRAILIERYHQAQVQGDKNETPADRHPISIEEMSGDDRVLMEDDAARQAWQVLSERFPDRRLTPDTNLQLELGIDSMEWMSLTLEVSQRTGVELEERLVASVETVRDLLQAIGESSTGAKDFRFEDIFDQPERFLDVRQRHWLKPLGPLQRKFGGAGYALNRLIIRRSFGLEVTGLEHLPPPPYVIAPNHTSYLDALVIAASLPQGTLERIWWAAWTGASFSNPVMRLISRCTHAVPIEQQHGARSSLAFGAAIIRRGDGLVWFPEGGISQDGRLQEFKPGLGLLLDHFRTPVVPVLIRGTFEAMPAGSRWPQRHKIQVIYGPPTDPAELLQQGDGERPEQRIMNALQMRVEDLGQKREPQHV